jgi:hypothetical protein
MWLPVGFFLIFLEGIKSPTYFSRCANVLFDVGQSTGKIMWDYEIFSVPVYLYDDLSPTRQFGLEVLCIIFLGVNIILEIIGERRSELKSNQIYSILALPLRLYITLQYQVFPEVNEFSASEYCRDDLLCLGLFPFLRA